MVQLGGAAVYLAAHEIGMGTRESVPDVARNLSRWVDVDRRRASSTTQTLVELGAARDGAGHQRAVRPRAPLPGHGRLLHAVGAGARPGPAAGSPGSATATTSATRSCCSPRCCGTTCVVASRRATRRDDDVLQACARARRPGDRDDGAATRRCEGADVIYTDVWISMGQEARARAAARGVPALPAQRDLARLRQPRALVMHCLPAHRGEEITDARARRPAAASSSIRRRTACTPRRRIIIHLLDGV